MAGIDLAGALDRSFDLAAQTLAAQRQFALTLVGAVERQVDTVVETVETSTRERRREVEGLRDAEDNQPQPGREGSERPTADKAEAPTGKQRVTQDTKPDRRSFEERNVEELRDWPASWRSKAARP